MDSKNRLAFPGTGVQGLGQGLQRAALPSRFRRVRPRATPHTAAHQAPRPWASPGKNTGVGCHVLLQRMKVKSEREVAQSCPTLRDPMDRNLPGPSIHGIFQARVLDLGAIAFRSQYVRTSSYKVSQSWGCNVHHGDYS